MARLKLIETEKDVKALILKWAKDRGAWSFAPIQRGMGAHGIPDRILAVPVVVTPEMVGQRIALFVALEAKAPGRRREENTGVSPLQLDQLQGIICAGGLAYVVDGTQDIQSVGELLDQLSRVGVKNADWSSLGKQKLNGRIGGRG